MPLYLTTDCDGIGAGNEGTKRYLFIAGRSEACAVYKGPGSSELVCRLTRLDEGGERRDGS